MSDRRNIICQMIHEAVLESVDHKPAGLLWMNYRLQAVTDYKSGSMHSSGTMFNPGKTQVMIEFSELCDMLVIIIPAS